MSNQVKWRLATVIEVGNVLISGECEIERTHRKSKQLNQMKCGPKTEAPHLVVTFTQISRLS